MRLLVSILHLVLFTGVASAQVVSTITFETTQSMDGLFVDDNGDLYAMEGFNSDEIFRITLDGGLTTFASGLDGPIHMTRSTDGNFYATDFSPNSSTGTVSRVTPDGTVSVFASVLAGPSDIVADSEGNLYVSHYGTLATGNGNSITKIAPDGSEDTFASGGFLRAPVGLDFDDEGNLYTANIFDGRIIKIAPDGTQSLFASVPQVSPFSIGHIVWAGGYLYATYLGANQIYQFDSDGTGRVYAGSGEEGGDDGAALSATFDGPNGIAASVTGDTLFVTEFGMPRNTIRMITPAATSSEGDGVAAPQALTLSAAYPNPFRTATTLRYTLAVPSEVTLEAYDVLGRVVDRTEVGRQGAGAHAVEWAPRGLPAGSYVLRLRAGGVHVARTVVRYE